MLPSVQKLCVKQIVLAGRAGLLGADEAAARVRQEARLMRERAAEARSRLQSTHVSTCFCLLNVACILLAAFQDWKSKHVYAWSVATPIADTCCTQYVI